MQKLSIADLIKQDEEFVEKYAEMELELWRLEDELKVLKKGMNSNPKYYKPKVKACKNKLAPLREKLQPGSEANMKMERISKEIDFREILEKKYDTTVFKAFHVEYLDRATTVCHNDGGTLFLAKEAVLVTSNNYKFKNVYCCTFCDTIFLERKGLVNFANKREDEIMVCKFDHCAQVHVVESVTAKFWTFDGNIVSINLNYCHNCRRYYITKLSLDMYSKQYTAILGNFRYIENSDGEYVEKEHEEYSPLALCGYTVSQAAGLTDNERRSILACIIAKNIMTKVRIGGYLTYFIQTIGQKKSNQIAANKWRADLAWLNDHNLDYQRFVKFKV